MAVAWTARKADISLALGSGQIMCSLQVRWRGLRERRRGHRIGAALILQDIRDERAWLRGGISPANWLVPLPDEAAAELTAAVGALRCGPLPLLLLPPTHFALPACRAVMARVGEKPPHGVGLAVGPRGPGGALSPDV